MQQPLVSSGPTPAQTPRLPGPVASRLAASVTVGPRVLHCVTSRRWGTCGSPQWASVQADLRHRPAGDGAYPESSAVQRGRPGGFKWVRVRAPACPWVPGLSLWLRACGQCLVSASESETAPAAACCRMVLQLEVRATGRGTGTSLGSESFWVKLGYLALSVTPGVQRPRAAACPEPDQSHMSAQPHSATSSKAGMCGSLV